MFPPQRAGAEFEHARGPLKRFHADEAAADDVNGSTIGFTEHRNKRLQTLPFRTSPTARKWMPADGTAPYEDERPLEPTMTPPGSFSERATHAYMQHDSMLPSQSSMSELDGNVPSIVETDGDMDMDMDGPADGYSVQGGGPHLAPGPAQPDQDSVVANRMPTPIQPSFAAQVRGNNWGGAAGNMHSHVHAHGNGPAPPPTAMHAEPEEAAMHTAYDDRTVPRSLDHPAAMGEWGMVHNRSLPSPISESGGEEIGSSGVVVDGIVFHDRAHDHAHVQEHEHEYGHSHVFDHEHDAAIHSTPIRPSAMHASPGPLPASSPIRDAMDSDPAATPSPKKGHSRSRHTIVAWTQQPGMKRTFSIGYRSDCEKCRNRVPGHFNHIIVS